MMAPPFMHPHADISPHHRAIQRYYASLQAFRDQNVEGELNVRPAFEFLLSDTAKLHGWTLITELSQKTGGSLVRPDGTLRDSNSLPRGYWEAKDTHDDLDAEIQRKIARGYQLSNIIFEDTQQGSANRPAATPSGLSIDRLLLPADEQTRL